MTSESSLTSNEIAARCAEAVYDAMVSLEPNGNFLPGRVVCDYAGMQNFKALLATTVRDVLEKQPRETTDMRTGAVISEGGSGPPNVCLDLSCKDCGGIFTVQGRHHCGPARTTSDELPKGAVPVMNPQGTGETGTDRPAAPTSEPRMGWAGHMGDPL